jgi:hypothetical protein
MRWNGVPRGTMDEVSSHVCWDLPMARPLERSFHLVFESHDGRAYVPIPEKREPASDIDTAVVVSLKALDPNRPIREADIAPVIGGPLTTHVSSRVICHFLLLRIGCGSAASPRLWRPRRRRVSEEYGAGSSSPKP